MQIEQFSYVYSNIASVSTQVEAAVSKYRNNIMLERYRFNMGLLMGECELGVRCLMVHPSPWGSCGDTCLSPDLWWECFKLVPDELMRVCDLQCWNVIEALES